MARIKWAEGAIADLEHIRRYVSAFQPSAARRLASRIGEAVGALAEDAAAITDVTGERAIVYPYLIRYRMIEGTVVVTAVRHSDEARIV